MKFRKIISAFIAFAICISGVFVYADSDRIGDISPLLSRLGIMQGDPDGNLRNDDFVTRAEFTKMAVASSDFNKMVAKNIRVSTYKDVPSDHWAAPYIRAAVDNGIVKGYTDATFRPDNDVTYEEAVTVMLKVLGYTDDEFGNSWPYGQVGVADNLNMTKNMYAEIGEPLTRRQVAILIYNALDTEMHKNSSSMSGGASSMGGTSSMGASQSTMTGGYSTKTKLLSVFDATKTEDAVLVSVSGDKAYTSEGAFELRGQAAPIGIGSSGDLFVKNGKDFLAFIPYGYGGGMEIGESEKYIVYSVIDNKIIAYRNNSLSTVEVQSGTTFYNKSTKTTYSALKPSIEMGDIIYVSRKDDGEIDYVTYEDGNVEGPVTITSNNDYTKYEGCRVLRNGNEISANELCLYDVVYKIPEINTVLAYSNKIVGIYENAMPNKDIPESIVVSGVTYRIESGEAFAKLSSGGEFSFGDTVTLLLGKNNEVADVVSSASVASSLCGYLYETGTKEFERSDLNKYTGFYIKIATPDGKTSEFVADKDYENCKNSICRVTFKDGIARVSKENSDKTSGVFDWNGRKLGNNAVSTDVKILDVSTTYSEEIGAFTTVFPTRIDGVNLTSSDILYCEKNGSNMINTLILKNVTGDMYKYGVVIKAQNLDSGFRTTGNYTIDIGGNTSVFTTNGSLFTISSGQPAKFVLSQSGQIESMQPIFRIDDKITDITHTEIKAGNKTYVISDKVVVYKIDSNYNYNVIPLDDIMGGKYSLSAFYDKGSDLGGRVRIIFAK